MVKVWRSKKVWLVGVGMVIGGGLVGLWLTFTFIPQQGVKGNRAVTFLSHLIVIDLEFI